MNYQGWNQIGMLYRTINMVNDLKKQSIINGIRSDIKDEQRKSDKNRRSRSSVKGVGLIGVPKL